MERAPAAGVATGTPDSGPLATATHAGALPAITPWPATSPLECRGQTWSIIILCYNEAATICRVATAVKSVMEEIAPGRHEIIIVDDGSDDGSVDIVGELGRTVPSVEAICHHANLGIGRALTTGYRRARNDNVCAVPGDGQFDVRELIPFSSVPERTCIAFYRIDNTTYSLFRNGLSYLNKQVNRLALGVDLKDVNWVKVYEAAVDHPFVRCKIDRFSLTSRHLGVHGHVAAPQPQFDRCRRGCADTRANAGRHHTDAAR